LTLGQRIWDKVRSYLEHIEELIGNLGNMLKTLWELIGNKTISTTAPSPPMGDSPTKEKKLGPWVHVALVNWLPEFFC